MYLKTIPTYEKDEEGTDPKKPTNSETKDNSKNVITLNTAEEINTYFTTKKFG